MKIATLRRWAWLPLAVALLAGFAYVVARSGPLAPIRVTVATVAEGRVERPVGPDHPVERRSEGQVTVAAADASGVI